MNGTANCDACCKGTDFDLTADGKNWYNTTTPVIND